MSQFGSSGWPLDVSASSYYEATQRARAEAEQQHVVMTPVTLVPTTDPVWPEDEAQEERSDKRAGRNVVVLAQPDQPTHVAQQELDVRLPDRLQGTLLPPNASAPTDGYDYYGLTVPTSFSANHGIIPRRLQLRLKFYDASQANSPLVPIAYALYPSTQVAKNITRLGEFRLDAGTASFKTFWPAIPDVLTVKTGGSLDIKRVKAKVMAVGLHSQMCEWYIADTEIVYTFSPSCIVQVPRGARLAVSASLHLEARKRLALVFYKSYYRNAHPRHYVLSGSGGIPSERNKMRERSEVTLQQAGVLHPDERTFAHGAYRHNSLEFEVPSPRLAHNVLSYERLIAMTRLHENQRDAKLFPTLGDHRVRLRPGWGLEEAKALHEILATLSVAKWWAKPSPEDIYAQLAGQHGDPLLLVEIEGNLAGGIQYKEPTDWGGIDTTIKWVGETAEQAEARKHQAEARKHEAMIEINVSRRWQGEEPCAEAIRLLARYLFDHRGYHRLIVLPAAANQLAIHSYEMAGFRRVGTEAARHLEYLQAFGYISQFFGGLPMELLSESMRSRP
jgi:aminoglycoside 6'-N-acetyltransferase